MYKLISKITGRPILVDSNKLYGIKTKPVEEPVKQEEAPVQTVETITTAEGDEQVVEDPLEIERKLMEEEAMREKKEAEKTKQAYDSACSILNSDDSEIKFLFISDNTFRICIGPYTSDRKKGSYSK